MTFSFFVMVISNPYIVCYKDWNYFLNLQVSSLVWKKHQYIVPIWRKLTFRECFKYQDFRESSLPFTYLGVPICAKKIPTTECEVILERMVQRIRVWSTRNLSYAGRATLVNSVLMKIHSYWAQIMIILKKILHRVNIICRNYLWKEMVDWTSTGQVAWGDMCRTKSEGGLGFRRIAKWNEAAIGK